MASKICSNVKKKTVQGFSKTLPKCVVDKITNTEIDKYIYKQLDR